ncbi:hypothetical protein TWF696_009430 [Orbilia brochopaga]|uniref:F-box domain-containing protein n=1 Tax=Orbilia brochopaga TaxID=3140254 RepID=A0AAV9UBF4_9PEZI
MSDEKQSTQAMKMAYDKDIEQPMIQSNAPADANAHALAGPAGPDAGGQLIFVQKGIAARRALGIVEILELILGFLAATGWSQFKTDAGRMHSFTEIDSMITVLSRCRAVNRFWRDIIDSSMKLNRSLWGYMESVKASSPCDADLSAKRVLVNLDAQRPRLITWTIGTDEQINFPFLSWFASRLSRCFKAAYDPSPPAHAHHVVFSAGNFPNSFFTWPPVTTVYMVLQFFDDMRPSQQKVSEIDWWTHPVQVHSATQNDQSYRESKGACVLLVVNRNGVTCNDVWRKLCWYMDVGNMASRSRRRYRLESVLMGVGKEYDYTSIYGHVRLEILHFTNAGFISYIANKLPGNEEEVKEIYEYTVLPCPIVHIWKWIVGM